MNGFVEYLRADRFIDALTEMGILPEGCIRVTIDARLDEPVTISYTVLSRPNLLNVAGGLEKASKEDAGKAH